MFKLYKEQKHKPLQIIQFLNSINLQNIPYNDLIKLFMELNKLEFHIVILKIDF